MYANLFFAFILSDFSSLLVLTKPVLPEEEKSCSKINLLLMLMLSVK
jgi:hypothetical protein